MNEWFMQSWFKPGYLKLYVPHGLTLKEVELAEKLIALQMEPIRQYAWEREVLTTRLSITHAYELEFE